MMNKYEHRVNVQGIFADRLAEVTNLIAEKNHISIGEIARRLGIKETVFYSWRRRGRSFPAIPTIQDMCFKMGVSVDYLLGLSDHKGIRK